MNAILIFLRIKFSRVDINVCKNLKPCVIKYLVPIMNIHVCFSGKLLLLLKDHKDIVKSLDFAPDGSLILVSGSRDGTLKFWDLNDDGNMYKSVRASARWVYDAKWSPHCTRVASVGSDKSVSSSIYN